MHCFSYADHTHSNNCFISRFPGLHMLAIGLHRLAGV